MNIDPEIGKKKKVKSILRRLKKLLWRLKDCLLIINLMKNKNIYQYVKKNEKVKVYECFCETVIFKKKNLA